MSIDYNCFVRAFDFGLRIAPFDGATIPNALGFAGGLLLHVC